MRVDGASQWSVARNHEVGSRYLTDGFDSDLYPLTFGGLVPYQNYVTNAYLWLLVGILFRLPSLLVQQPDSAAAGSSERASIGGLQF